MPVEESLPSSESINDLNAGQKSQLKCVRQLVEVKQPVVSPVGRHDHVGEGVTKHVPSGGRLDGQEVDVPALPFGLVDLDGSAIREELAAPAWVGHAHAQVEKDEDALQQRPSRPRLETRRELELVGNRVTELDAREWSEEIIGVAVPAAVHLDAAGSDVHERRGYAGDILPATECAAATV